MKMYSTKNMWIFRCSPIMVDGERGGDHESSEQEGLRVRRCIQQRTHRYSGCLPIMMDGEQGGGDAKQQ